MGAVVGSSLLLASASCFRICRDMLHPAVVFPSIWGITLIAVGMAEPFGYLQISTGSFLLFVVGVIFFIVGALTGSIQPRRASEARSYDLNYRKIVWFCIALHALMLPISWAEVQKITEDARDIFAAAYYLRSASVSGEERVGALVGNYLFAGFFFIPVLMVGWLQGAIKARTLLVLAMPWILLNIFVGGRSGLIFLIFSLLYVYFILNGRISLKACCMFIAVFLAVLIAGNLLVGKIEAGIDDEWSTILLQSTRGFFDYFLQGPILFSEYFDYRAKINPTWDALIFFCQALEKIDACVVPPLHQEFAVYSTDGDFGNVYSIFFSIYPKYGWMGTALIPFVYGFWASFHHARQSKWIFHFLMGGFLFSAALLSVFSDQFGGNVYFFVKILLISAVASLVFKKT